MNDSRAVKQDVRQAATLLADARSALHEGRDFELVAFNHALNAACQGAIRLPPDIATDVRPALTALLADLEAFRREMEVCSVGQAPADEPDTGPDHG